ncbi:tudor domain-containing protein 7B-like protein [Euroglyphus maynei]|uniref:Tudor domain-containing protein 7B-like protein n=1 Tax=Euroglyphus maynei TaxID=6958 RepID=A0A1Y3B8T9_EURMA|nr:tudor domain-containing protein 7B-like protein [Euroglyphus maynei]
MNGEIEHVPSQKPVKNLQIQAGSLMLSFVYSSRNFFVNLQHDKMIEFYDYFEIDKELIKLLPYEIIIDRIYAVIKLLPYEIIIDRIYAVFNPADESYYRAKVLDFIPNDSVRITFIDYGEEMDFEKQNLFKLLPPYDKEPPFALNCFIDGMIFDVKPNDLVVVKYQNNYFRSLVLAKNSNDYEIFAFDIGFIGVVDQSQIYTLLDIFSLKKYPPFIVCCSLHKLVPFKDNYKVIAIDSFRKQMNKPLNINVCGFIKGKFQIEIFIGETTLQSTFVRCRFAKISDE